MKLDLLADRIGEGVRGCLNEQATMRRLDELTAGLTAWFALAEQLAASSEEIGGRRQRLRQACVGEPLATLVELIDRDAPLPGRILRQVRGDLPGIR